MRYVFSVVVLLAFAGCGVLESTKDLNWQNRDAGDKLSHHPDPEVAQVGADIRDNADAISADIGESQTKAPYSHDMSATLRNAQTAQLAARQAWKDFAVELAGAAASFFGAGWLWTWLKKINLGKALTSVFKGIESLPPDIANRAKDAVLKGGLKGGVSDLIHGLVKKATTS